LPQTVRQTHRQIDRQTDGQTDRRMDKQTDRWTNTETDRQTICSKQQSMMAFKANTAQSCDVSLYTVAYVHTQRE